MASEYEKFVEKMNAPRVVIDNETCENSTVVKVNSGSRHGMHLEVVQVLADLHLDINKAYISSDGPWWMDVFHVTDQDGNKVADQTVLDYTLKSLTLESSSSSSLRSSGVNQSTHNTVIELLGSDRPGLLSELSSLLTDLNCNVVNAEMWTAKARAAAVIEVTDEWTGLPVTDKRKISTIINLIQIVLEASNNGPQKAKIIVSHGVTHIDRRLHQMMYADREYEDYILDNDQRHMTTVNVANFYNKNYSVVNIRSQNRPKLLFDTLCTLTDLRYMVFHASIIAAGPEVYQEYFIRHADGHPILTDAEGQHVAKCLEAAILRRASEGVKLELHTTDRIGLLSDVTRIFRENGLVVTRAEVRTKEGKALDMFYVRDASGNSVDEKTLDSITQCVGVTVLKVKAGPEVPKRRFSERNRTSLFGQKGLYSLGKNSLRNQVVRGKERSKPLQNKSNQLANSDMSDQSDQLIECASHTFRSLIFSPFSFSLPESHFLSFSLRGVAGLTSILSLPGGTLESSSSSGNTRITSGWAWPWSLSASH